MFLRSSDVFFHKAAIWAIIDFRDRFELDFIMDFRDFCIELDFIRDYFEQCFLHPGTEM